MKHLAVVIVALILFARPAIAEDKAKARLAYRSASKHYDLGEFREALADFKEAYRNFEEPSFLFNIGQCHRQLGENEQAIRFFRTFLSKSPNAPNYADVSKMIDKLEQTMREQQAAAPAPQTASPAAPELVAPRRPAPTPEKAAPERAPSSAPAAAPVATPASSAARADAAVTSAAPPRARTPVYKKWWLWTTVGVVAVGVGVGLGIGLTRPHGTPTAQTNLGTYQPSF